jgi:uncharacterized protein (DUF1330 family)
MTLSAYGGMPTTIRRWEPKIRRCGGNWEPGRLVILPFPDVAAARALYNDPEYEPLKVLR